MDDQADNNADGQANGDVEAHGQNLRLLEALIFASATMLDEEALAERLPEGADVNALLADLAESYAGRGVNLVKVAGAWTFRTAPDLKDRLKIETQVSRKLSRAAVETLAIIAYHQPVTRAEIEAIRGVGLSKGTLDLLFEQGWIQPMGRRRAPGKPVIMTVSDADMMRRPARRQRQHHRLSSRGGRPAARACRGRGGRAARNRRRRWGRSTGCDRKGRVAFWSLPIPSRMIAGHGCA